MSPDEEVSMTHASHSPDATVSALPPELPPAETSSLIPLIVFLTDPKYECVECELQAVFISMQPHYQLQSKDSVPHTKLIKIRFPGYDGACCAQSCHHRGIVRASESLERTRTAGGGIVRGADVVLYGDTSAIESRTIVSCKSISPTTVIYS